MPEKFEIYYSVRDIAARLSFSTRTVRRWIAEGAIPNAGILHIGSDIRVPWSAIAAFLARHNFPTWTPPAIQQREHEDRQVQPGISARNAGELRRKSRQLMEANERS